MRIASWNLNHRARQRTIPTWVASELAATNADVIVCTEYVEGRSHQRFVSELNASGFASVTTSAVTPGENQVLIASRVAHRRGLLAPPVDISESVPSNALHVELGGFNVVGFRMPSFPSSSAPLKRRTWQWVQDAARQLELSRAVIIGDMNTQRGDPKGYCGDCIEAVLGTGWTEVVPPDGYSWRHLRGRQRRIDFGFASPALRTASARYDWDFLGRNGISKPVVGVPDHALLVADLHDADPVATNQR
jgi:hypothetical protein